MKAQLFFLVFACVLFGSFMLAGGATSKLDMKNLARLKKYIMTEKLNVHQASKEFENLSPYDYLESSNRSINFKAEILKSEISRNLQIAARLYDQLSPYILQFSDVDTVSSFTAYPSEPIDIVNGDFIYYNSVEQSQESALYGIETVFTAPFHAPYVFMVSVAPDYGSSETVTVEIVKNGDVFGTVVSDNHPVTNMFLIELFDNDKVGVRMTGDTGKIRGGKETRFMGFSL